MGWSSLAGRPAAFSLLFIVPNSVCFRAILNDVCLHWLWVGTPEKRLRDCDCEKERAKKRIPKNCGRHKSIGPCFPLCPHGAKWMALCGTLMLPGQFLGRSSIVLSRSMVGVCSNNGRLWLVHPHYITIAIARISYMGCNNASTYAISCIIFMLPQF